jgi:type IV secretory pathway TrbD component
MMPLLMLRFPIMLGSSFTESVLLELEVVAGVFGFVSLAWAVLLAAGSLEGLVVWAKLAMEPAAREDNNIRAVNMREKLFILKNLQKFEHALLKRILGKIFPRLLIEGFYAGENSETGGLPETAACRKPLIDASCFRYFQTRSL